MPLRARIVFVAHKTTFPGKLCTISHSNLRTNSQPAPHITPHLTHQISPLWTQMPPAHGEKTPAPPCNSASLQFATNIERPLSLVPHDTRPCYRCYIAPPHLTGNFPGERPELWQLSSSCQTTAWPLATRVPGKGDLQGLLVAIKLLAWSSISTLSDINSSWEFFKEIWSLSCTHLSNLVFGCHTLPPAHDRLKLVMRQLSWNKLPSSHARQIQPQAISVPSTKLGTSVCPPSEDPGNNIFPISSLNSQTSLPPPNPGGFQLCHFLVYLTPPSLPLPQMAAQLQLHVKRLNA